MVKMFLDRRFAEERLVRAIPNGADPNKFLAVNVACPPPTCCKDAVYNWAIHYEVPGNLAPITVGLGKQCRSCAGDTV